jgi:hypothetical protein
VVTLRIPAVIGTLPEHERLAVSQFVVQAMADLIAEQ